MCAPIDGGDISFLFTTLSLGFEHYNIKGVQ